MEVREILVANTKTQKKETIMTNASTLGELKAAFDANGIDYEGMSFTVGCPQMTLISDDAQLPTNVNYKGRVTNNLIILLTNTKDKIASGFDGKGTRSGAFATVREYGLQEGIKELYGTDYTHVSTKELWDYIYENAEEDTEEEENVDTSFTEGEEAADDIYDLIKKLANRRILSHENLLSIQERLEELADIIKETGNVTYKVGNIEISDNDIDAITASLS